MGNELSSGDEGPSSRKLTPSNPSVKAISSAHNAAAAAEGDTPSLGRAYMCLLFRKPGLISLINGESVRQTVLDSVLKHWDEKEIESETTLFGAPTIKLAGIPYESCIGKDDSITLRKIAGQILADLWCAGWTLVASSELSRKTNLTSWFFRKDATEERSARNIVCLCLSSFDALILIDPSDDERLRSGLLHTITQYYKPGLDEKKVVNNIGATIYILNELPWDSDGTARKHGLWLLLRIIDQIYNLGYNYYGRVNFKSTVDSLYFIHSDTKPNSPVPNGPAFVACRCILTLEKKDRIRLMGAPAQLISFVREMIPRDWPKGLIEDGAKDDKDKLVWDFKLAGNPWIACGDDEGFIRRLLMHLMEGFTSFGWRVIMTADTSRRKDDTSMFIFETFQPAIPMRFLCLSLTQMDRFQIIGADAATALKVGLLLSKFWPYGMEEQPTELPGAPAWRLCRKPWGHEAKYGIAARALFCALLNALEGDGWTVASTADVSAIAHSDPSDSNSPPNPDSWFFRKRICSSSEESNVSTAAPFLNEDLPSDVPPPVPDVPPPEF